MKTPDLKYLFAFFSISLLLSSCGNEMSFSDSLKKQGENISNIGTNYEKGEKMMAEGNKMIKEGNEKMQKGAQLSNEGQSLANSGLLKAEEGRVMMLNATTNYNNSIITSPYYINGPR